MPEIAREIEIEYGSYTVGGITDRLVHNKYRVDDNYENATVEFNFIIQDDNDGAFADKCREAEAAFRKPRQRITVRINGSNLFDANPDDAKNTGYNAIPSIRKVGENFDTGRSREYGVVIEVQLPADLTGQSGRRESSIEVTYTASRRRVLAISGAYTALTINLALPQYQASIGSFVSTIQAALGWTCELIDENFNHDDANKNITFRRVFDEIIFNQASGTLNHPSIVKQQISISRSAQFPGDSQDRGTTKRAELITIIADMSIDKDVTTGLNSLYTGTIKPYMISLAKDTFSFASIAILSETPDIRASDNQIRAVITFLGIGASNILEFVRNVEVEDVSGKILIPVWDGNKLAYHVFDGPQRLIRVTVDTELLFEGTPQVVGLLNTKPNFQPFGAVGVGGAAGFKTFSNVPGTGQQRGEDAKVGWVQLSKKVNETDVLIGDESDNFKTLARITTTIEQFVEAPTSPAGVNVTEPGGVVVS